MSAPAQTRGTFFYRRPVSTNTPDAPDAAAEQARLAAAADYRPVLRRWRHRCSERLIDDSGKIRNVFTRTEPGAEDNVSRVIRELNQIPEAVADLETALDAQRTLSRLGQQPVEMRVRDARALPETSLDENGFQLVRHVSRVTDWQDDRQLASVYYQEINDLVRDVTGATHVFSNNHLRRQSEPAEGGNGPLAELMVGSRGPARSVHNDFTECYGEGLIRTIASNGVPHTQTFGLTHAMQDAGVTEAQLRSSRMLVVNTWRAIGAEPLRRSPLAVADRRTVSRACLHRTLIGNVPSGEPRGGIEIFSAEYDPAHDWYYYPDMTQDEVLLWKGYDSAEVPARPNLHSAFDDPRTPADAPERHSVEVRVLCLLPR